MCMYLYRYAILINKSMVYQYNRKQFRNILFRWVSVTSQSLRWCDQAQRQKPKVPAKAGSKLKIWASRLKVPDIYARVWWHVCLDKEGTCTWDIVHVHIWQIWVYIHTCICSRCQCVYVCCIYIYICVCVVYTVRLTKYSYSYPRGWYPKLSKTEICY